MLVQVTAYVVLDKLVVQATTARTTDTGRSWEHRVLEEVAIPTGCEDSAWDLIWLVGQLLADRAFERTAKTVTGGSDSAGADF